MNMKYLSTTLVPGKCSEDTNGNCIEPGPKNEEGFQNKEPSKEKDWIEQEVIYGFRVWHIMFLSIGAVLMLVILLCCCFKFRIPRTKQEIEGDANRRKILKKFRKRLKAIQNQELDEMDLKKALDKIRAEFKSDTESAAQSEAGVSFGTNSSPGMIITGVGDPQQPPGSTYRRASQIEMDISLDAIRTQGLRGRLALALSRFFGRSKSVRQRTPPTIPGEPSATTSAGQIQPTQQAKKPLTKASTSKPAKPGKSKKSSEDPPPEKLVKLTVQNETKPQKSKEKEKSTKTKPKKSTVPKESKVKDKDDKKSSAPKESKQKDDKKSKAPTKSQPVPAAAPSKPSKKPDSKKSKDKQSKKEKPKPEKSKSTK